MSIQARFRLARPGFTLDVNLALPGRGVTALFGHSGSGKTTLLRLIAGLERAPEGRLVVGDEVWQEGTALLPAHRRPLGYVFQEASLFPHLSARGNLDYGRKRSPATALDAQALEHIIELLGIGGLLDRRPDQLSGGERQRVAIARALAVGPRLLLMDEPLSALDLQRKREILPYLERLHDELEIPILYVTHSPDEVARLADHLVVLEQGRVVAQGGLTETLARIDLPFNLGEEAGVVIEGTVAERDRWGLMRVAFPGGDLWVRDAGVEMGRRLRLRALARDLSLTLGHQSGTSILNHLPAVVAELAPGEHPALVLARVMVGETPFVARLTARSADALGLAPGKRVWLQIKSVAVVE